MKTYLYNIIVLAYTIATIMLLKSDNRYLFLSMGILGQFLMVHLSHYIYKSNKMWSSFHMYALVYILYVLSFTCIDIFIYMDNPHNFSGYIHENRYKMFVDFTHVNMSIVSTIGYSDIIPKTTISRSYSSYKIMIAIFMIVFLVSDIVVKTKK